jgi:hypothetical protein
LIKPHAATNHLRNFTVNPDVAEQIACLIDTQDFAIQAAEKVIRCALYDTPSIMQLREALQPLRRT